MNLLLLTDSYKFTHWLQYPKKTTKVYSYFESRGGEFDEIVFFGLQYYLKRYLEGQVVTRDKIDYAEERVNAHLPGRFNRAGWEYILDKYEGRLPIRIRAVPEGTVLPPHNVMMTVENTDPNCYWLTNYLETLLVMTWYPSTVATQSRSMKQSLLYYLNETGGVAGIDFKLHDFGFRGSTSVESAGIGGAAHLVNFKGTDTFQANEVLYEYYDEYMAGFSIPASEHSTITSWGPDRECEAMRNMLVQYPDGLMACVSDSFDIMRACKSYWGGALKDMVLERDGVLVVRPDSGYPPKIVCQVLEALGDAFGTTENNEGYKVLHPKVRVIQGDGIDHEMLEIILAHMKSNKWSAENIAFGSGGGLLQKVNRDTCKYAFKCSYAVVDKTEIEVYKDPVTDPGKKSKRGLLSLVRNGDGSWSTKGTSMLTDFEQDELRTVFLNGEVREIDKLAAIRERAKC